MDLDRLRSLIEEVGNWEEDKDPGYNNRSELTKVIERDYGQTWDTFIEWGIGQLNPEERTYENQLEAETRKDEGEKPEKTARQEGYPPDLGRDLERLEEERGKEDEGIKRLRAFRELGNRPKGVYHPK